MPNVAFVRSDLKKKFPLYYAIRDCIEGEVKIKQMRNGKTKYLPKPNAEDTSDENEERYKSYVDRAVFYNVTGRTIKGLIGQIFLRDAVVNIPPLLTSVEEDANGGGVDLIQSSKRSVGYVLSYGRAGLFVDYPETEEVTTLAELQSGSIRPTINTYAPWRAINYRTKTRGAKVILSMVVLSETYVAYDDGFEVKEDEQFRVLRLGKSPENKEEGIVEGDDIYTVEIWRGDKGSFGIDKSYQPKDAKGMFLNEIPFMFMGAENNDVEVDNPPLYDLASLNLAHFRNSADFEESCFFVGQPTPYFSGLTEEWVNKIMKGVVAIGSRSPVPLPVGGEAGLLQAEPNIMPKEAMEHKERQMVALGAKLVEQKTVQRTATEASIETISENSTLASSAKNVSAAYTWALEWCAKFVGADEGAIQFDLNTDFDIAEMTAQDRQEVVAEWQAGAITFGEMRDNLRKAGVATLEDDKAKAAIAKELDDAPDLSGNPNGNSNADE